MGKSEASDCTPPSNTDFSKGVGGKQGAGAEPCHRPQPSSTPRQRRGSQHPGEPPCTQPVAQRLRARCVPSANPGRSALSLGRQDSDMVEKGCIFPWVVKSSSAPLCKTSGRWRAQKAATCTCTQIESLHVAGTRRVFACITIQSAFVIIAWANPACRWVLSWAC